MYFNLSQGVVELMLTFEPDAFKNGGRYRKVSGKVMKVDEVDKVILLNKHSIPLSNITDIES